MASVQLGILLDEELKDWFVDKCRSTRSTDASKRLLSAATVIAAYLEHFRKIDDINPWGIVPQLKGDTLTRAFGAEEVVEITPPVATPAPLDNNLSEELKSLSSEVEALKALPTMDVINQLIEEKITEVLARLKSEQLPNPTSVSISNSESNFSSNSNKGGENLEQVEESNHNIISASNSISNFDSNENEQEIKSELEVDTTLIAEVEVIPELEPTVMQKDPETSPVAEVKDLAGGASGSGVSVAPETPEPTETSTPPVVLPETAFGEDLDEEPTPEPEEPLEVVVVEQKQPSPSGMQGEVLSGESLQETIKSVEDAINLWKSNKDYGLERIRRDFGISLKKTKMVPNYMTDEEYNEIVKTKRPGKKV